MGRGVEASASAALQWFTKAANQGNAEARFELGLLCRDGRGTLKDPARAYYWLNLAASQGVRKALDARDALEPNLTAEQMVEAERLSRASARAPKTRTEREFSSLVFSKPGDIGVSK
jgi:TPR repeat protein